MNSFHVIGVDTIVPDERVCHCNNLSAIGRVCENFLVTGHACIKNDFAGCLSFHTKRFAGQDYSVFKNEFCFHSNSDILFMKKPSWWDGFISSRF